MTHIFCVCEYIVFTFKYNLYFCFWFICVVSISVAQLVARAEEAEDEVRKLKREVCSSDNKLSKRMNLPPVMSPPLSVCLLSFHRIRLKR